MLGEVVKLDTRLRLVDEFFANPKFYMLHRRSWYQIKGRKTGFLTMSKLGLYQVRLSKGARSRPWFPLYKSPIDRVSFLDCDQTLVSKTVWLLYLVWFWFKDSVKVLDSLVALV